MSTLADKTERGVETFILREAMQSAIPATQKRERVSVAYAQHAVLGFIQEGQHIKTEHRIWVFPLGLYHTCVEPRLKYLLPSWESRLVNIPDAQMRDVLFLIQHYRYRTMPVTMRIVQWAVIRNVVQGFPPMMLPSSSVPS